MERGLSLSEAARSLGTLAPPDKRGAVVQVGNITIINDCYNSNPTALNAMVDALAAMPAKRRIVVAGEMLELGPSGGAIAPPLGPAHGGKGDRYPGWSSRSGASDGRGRRAAGMQGRIRSHARRSRRVAGTRNSRRRCRAAQSVARGKVGTGFGEVVSRQSSVVSKSKAADASVLTTDD